MRELAAILVALAALGGCAAAGPPAGPPGPWVEQYLHAPQPSEESRIAFEAVRAFGPESVPDLTTALGDTDPGIRVRAMSLLLVQSRDAAPAVPQLIRCLGSVERRDRLFAALVLANVGPEARDAVPALTGLLSDTSAYPQVRTNAALALGEIGPAAVDAVPALVASLKEEDRTGEYRLRAREAIRRILEL